MNRRLIVKTSLICFGIFILIASLLAWVVGSNAVLAGEGTVEIVMAGARIESGTVITPNMLLTKSIPLEARNKYMLEKVEDVAGTKAQTTIEAGDFIRTYAIKGRDSWFKEDDRITVLPMEVDERMANLIVRNSFIDIKMVPKAGKSLPKSVLTKILVSDVIDENGVSLGENGVNKKAYVKVVLSKTQRDRLFAARETGKLIYELYCDSSQKQPDEEFVIPQEFY